MSHIIRKVGFLLLSCSAQGPVTNSDLTFKWLVSCAMTFFRGGTPRGHLPPQGDQGGACGRGKVFFSKWLRASFKTQSNPHRGLRILCQNGIIWVWKYLRIIMVIKPLEYPKCLLLSKCEPSKKNLSLIVQNVLQIVAEYKPIKKESNN